jgi:hypothetical protein
VKKKLIYIVIIIAILILITFVFFNIRFQRGDVYTAKGFNKENGTPILSISDKIELNNILEIIKTADKIKGKIDVSTPNYIIELFTSFNGMKTIYLWLDKDSIKGMLMYQNSNEIGYSISEDNTLKLKQIILLAIQ